MVFLEHAIEPYRHAIVPADVEAYGIGAVSGREPRARLSRVSEVAHLSGDGPPGLELRAIIRKTGAFVAVPQRQTNWMRPETALETLLRMEKRARHSTYTITGIMPNDRLDTLKSLTAQNPQDSFVRYGLAMEYSRLGEFEQAIAEYRNLLAINPDYVAAYFHGGQSLEKLGRVDEARRMYRDGIEASTRAGDMHTRSELEAALDALG
jgi:tetratricopeptide (TPR) repeat protein